MLRLATDEDVHGGIYRGLRRHAPDLDVVRVQDVGLGNTPDLVVLEWADQERRVLITSDRSTMVAHAWNRVSAGQPMFGVLAVRRIATIGSAIAEISFLARYHEEEEMRNQVLHIPL
jgi:hypothetical protein